MDPLAQLKDIHIPNDVSIWPLAPIWYIAVLILVIVLIMLYVIFRKRGTKAARVQAIKKIRSLEAAYRANGNQTALLQGLSIILRRYAISKFGSRSATLVGKDWLKFLDKTGGDGKFLNGCGNILASGPYVEKPSFKVKPLVDLATNWIKTAKLDEKNV